jgi:hypothetical protein
MFEPPKEPFNVPIVIVALIAFWGSVVSFLLKTKFRGVTLLTLFWLFVREVIICTFAAFLIHALCMINDVTGWANMLLVAIGAHLGTETIKKVTDAFLRGEVNLKGSFTRDKGD